MNKIRLNKTVTQKKLLTFGFQKYGSSYRLIVPVCTYNAKPTITVDFYIDLNNGLFEYEVIDQNSQNLYNPYYVREYGRNDIANQADQIIQKYLQEMQDTKIIKKIRRQDNE